MIMREPKDIDNGSSSGDEQLAADFPEYVTPASLSVLTIARSDKFPGGEWLVKPSGEGPITHDDIQVRTDVEQRLALLASSRVDFAKQVFKQIEFFREFTENKCERTAGRLMLWLDATRDETGVSDVTYEHDKIVRGLPSNWLTVAEQADALTELPLKEIMTFSMLTAFHPHANELAEEQAAMNVIRLQEAGYDIVAKPKPIPPEMAIDEGAGFWVNRSSFLEGAFTHYKTPNVRLALIGHAVRMVYPGFDGEPRTETIGRAQTIVRRPDEEL